MRHLSPKTAALLEEALADEVEAAKLVDRLVVGGATAGLWWWEVFDAVLEAERLTGLELIRWAPEKI
jgi:hypothetical protein